MRAAERALPLCAAGSRCAFAILPDGEDPDSFLRRHGAEALRSVLSKAHTLSQMIWRLETRGKRFETRKPARRSVAGCAPWPDWRQTRICAAVSGRVSRPAGGVCGPQDGAPPCRGPAFLGLGRGRGGSSGGRLGRSAAPGGGPAGRPGVVQRPSMLVGLEETFDQVNFDSPLVEKLRNEILFWYTSDSLADRGELKDYLRRFPELENIVENGRRKRRDGRSCAA